MAIASMAELEHPHHRIILAQDQDTWRQAMRALRVLGPVVGVAKYNSLAVAHGPKQTVRDTRRNGSASMLDLKVHDINDTNRRTVRELTTMGASIITVHASNSLEALKAAVAGVDEALEGDPSLTRPWLAGVTVLTSLRDPKPGEVDSVETCESVYGADRKTKVRDFAHRAADAGLEAIVCSPQEAEMVKNDPVTTHLKAIVPAIRPEYSLTTPDEQATATTPRIAIEAGADMLVLGRPLIYAEKYGLSGPEAAAIVGEQIAEGMGL